jgi:hypothetical protein
LSAFRRHDCRSARDGPVLHSEKGDLTDRKGVGAGDQ